MRLPDRATLLRMLKPATFTVPAVYNQGENSEPSWNVRGIW
jgi:hypothetical protein